VSAGTVAWSLAVVTFGVVHKPFPMIFGPIAMMALALVADDIVSRISGGSGG
jgi:hypothetical protein